MVKRIQTILSVFGHFVGLVLKGLKYQLQYGGIHQKPEFQFLPEEFHL